MKIAQFPTLACLTVSLLLWVSTASHAASGVEMNLTDLVSNADRIVVGKCVEVTSEWVGNKIYTKNTIEVTDNIKGDKAASYVVTTLGGTAFHAKLNTEVTMDVSGGLYFNPSEDVVLFTKQNVLGQHQVVGMSQGKFNIVVDKKNGERVIPLAEKKIQSEKLVKDILAPQARTKFPVGEQTVISSEQIKLDEFINKIKSKMDHKKK